MRFIHDLALSVRRVRIRPQSMVLLWYFRDSYKDYESRDREFIQSPPAPPSFIPFSHFPTYTQNPPFVPFSFFRRSVLDP
jgi:hypothetical protein